MKKSKKGELGGKSSLGRAGVEQKGEVPMKIFEEIGKFAPNYPAPNLDLHMWQLYGKKIGDLDEPVCSFCYWQINEPLAKTKVDSLLSVGFEFIRENFGRKAEDYMKERVKKRLKEFWDVNDNKYNICRFCLFVLIRVELRYYIIKKFGLDGLSRFREKLEEYTKRFLVLYDWDVPEGGAGGNPL